MCGKWWCCPGAWAASGPHGQLCLNTGLHAKNQWNWPQCLSFMGSGDPGSPSALAPVQLEVQNRVSSLKAMGMGSNQALHHLQACSAFSPEDTSKHWSGLLLPMPGAVALPEIFWLLTGLGVCFQSHGYFYFLLLPPGWEESDDSWTSLTIPTCPKLLVLPSLPSSCFWFVHVFALIKLNLLTSSSISWWCYDNPLCVYLFIAEKVLPIHDLTSGSSKECWTIIPFWLP